MKKIIATLTILLFLLTACSSNTEGITKYEAECIAEHSTLYISNGCIACSKQESILGENFQYLNTIDCKQDPSECANHNILAVPTWIINEKEYTGYKQIEELKQLTGC